jgi:hypothetical protein
MEVETRSRIVESPQVGRVVKIAQSQHAGVSHSAAGEGIAIAVDPQRAGPTDLGRAAGLSTWAAGAASDRKPLLEWIDIHGRPSLDAPCFQHLGEEGAPL